MVESPAHICKGRGTDCRQNKTKGAPFAGLLEKKSKTGGRNNAGRITTRHRGGGHKQHYRVIDFKRDKDGIKGHVERIEYDPNRTAHIALVLYADGGRLASKPYAASGNYINTMSDYCRKCRYSPAKKTGEGACPFNPLYWHFMHRHRDRLESNHRVGRIRCEG